APHPPPHARRKALNLATTPRREALQSVAASLLVTSLVDALRRARAGFASRRRGRRRVRTRRTRPRTPVRIEARNAGMYGSCQRSAGITPRYACAPPLMTASIASASSSRLLRAEIEHALPGER